MPTFDQMPLQEAMLKTATGKTAQITQVPDKNGASAEAPVAPANAPDVPPAGEGEALHDLVVALKDEVATLTGQLEAKDRQLSELPILLQQAKTLPLPQPKPWWMFWR